MNNEDPAPRRAWVRWLLLLSLFLMVVGARLWLVEKYTCSLPFWDQWAGEGDLIIKPWLQHTLQLKAFFAPHNEHRLVLTRLIALGLFLLNGQWDAQVEMTANAALCGLSALVMTAMFWQGFGARWRWVIVVAVTLLFILPFSWENTLAGFQNQFYLLLFFSLVTLWGLAAHAPFSKAWWVGAVSALLACLTMASGFMAASAVLVWDIARLVRRPARPAPGKIITWLWCLVLTAVGWETRTIVAAHAVLKAASLAAFLTTLGRCLAWPFFLTPALAWFIYLPLLVVGGIYLWRPAMWNERNERGQWYVEFLLSLALWVLVQAAAVAYARGGDGLPPASRYMDLLALGVVLNFLALLVLLSLAGRLRRVVAGGVVIWVFVVLAGLAQLTVQNFTSDMPGRRDVLRIGERNVRGYLATGDFRRYLAYKPLFEIPFPDAASLAAMLDDPNLRKTMPADVRPPLTVQPAGGTAPADGFVPGGYFPAVGDSPLAPGWGSYALHGDQTEGELHAVLVPPATLPYLEFQFAGYLGKPGLSFTLRDRQANRQVEFAPASLVRERWHTDYIKVPGPNLELLAADHNPETWFAFSGPVEVGSLSYWSGYLLRRGGLLFAVGLLLFCILPASRLVSLLASEADAKIAADRPA